MTPISSNDVGSICGLVVCTRPEQLDAVADCLGQMPGVEVHDKNPQGKLVVTVEEGPGEKIMVNRISQISAAEGVLSSALVYTHQE